MFNSLEHTPQRIVIVGDTHVSSDIMEDAVRASRMKIADIKKVFWGPTDKTEFATQQLQLEKNGPDAVPYAQQLDALMKDADVLLTHFCPVPGRLIQNSPHLKAILVCRSGVEHIDLAAASQRNIPVIHVIRNAVPVAEFTLGLMLSVSRNIAVSHSLLMQGRWKREYPNVTHMRCLQNMTVGLLGLGNVGIELAVRLQALGVSLLAYDEWLDKERLARHGLENIHIVPDKETLFSQSDMVSLHLRLTPETQNSIDKRYFSLMKPTAYFINAARGGLVKQEDLVEALKAGRIAGAALDVFDAEPLHPDAGLQELENVTITPHIAGETLEALAHSPYLLLQALDQILLQNVTERIVNFSQIDA